MRTGFNNFVIHTGRILSLNSKPLERGNQKEKTQIMDQIQQMINQHTQALGQFAELIQASRNHRKEASRLDKKADFLLENIVELTSQIQKAQKQQQEEALSQPE